MDIMVQKWQKLNPEYEMQLYDNNRCAEFLLTNFGKLFVDIFDFLVKLENDSLETLKPINKLTGFECHLSYLA